MKHKFKFGDIVHLNSGSPPLTVLKYKRIEMSAEALYWMSQSLKRTFSDEQLAEYVILDVLWIDSENTIRGDSFHQDMLTLQN